MPSDRTARVLGVIPARWASSRFPGKPLHPIAGKPLLQHVWERCREAKSLEEVIVATDDERIAAAARDFGANVAMTRDDHPSGTDRIAETAMQHPEATHLVNIQGDEPLIDPGLIDSLAHRLIADPSIEMITAANPIEEETEFLDPNVVKVVLDQSGAALYFSRSPIPHPRDAPLDRPALRHHGIYGFSRDFLLRFVTWPPSPLEKCEKLEQLRALDRGARIDVVITSERSLGVDTPDQVAEIESLLLSRTNSGESNAPACQPPIATTNQ